MGSVLITGAAQGFGRELLRVYAARGWITFPLVRKAADVPAIIAEFPQNCHPIVADVGLDTVGDKIRQVLSSHTETLELLINNAGIIIKNRGLLSTNTTEIMDHFNVHCLGSYRCVVATLPFLQKAEKPIIVNVTSRWGSIARTLEWPKGLIYSYQIAKCAQNMFSTCLNQEFRNSKIKVLSLHPGRLKTAVAPFDADTDPREAALKLAEWADNAENIDPFRCYDIMSGDTIEW